jgi:anaerobic C4-dicarboxylate transporter
MGADKRARWFAIGIGATAGLGLIAIVMISNLVREAPQSTVMYLICAAVPLAWVSGFGLGRGRND